ncbi:MAG: hypothetical protein KAS72_04110 [Phycisphaerales bacterium]|nr:hypothetical protein [Phycisphaerales bacterium]
MGVNHSIAKLVDCARDSVTVSAAGITIVPAAVGAGAGVPIVAALICALAGTAAASVWRTWARKNDLDAVTKRLDELSSRRRGEVIALGDLARELGVGTDTKDSPIVMLAELLAAKSDGIAEALRNEDDRTYLAIADYITHRYERFAALPEHIRIGLTELRSIREAVDALQYKRDRDLDDDLATLLERTERRPNLGLDIWDPAETPGNPFLYSVRRVPLLGRSSEMASLEAFLDAPEEVLWWLWTGSAGAGKTRLAHELCLRARRFKNDTSPNGWCTGFLSTTEPFNEWERWDLERPTLVIVDYTQSRASVVGEMIRRTRESAGVKGCRVRFLLLERDAGEWVKRDLIGTSDRREALHRTRHGRYGASGGHVALEPLHDDALWNCFGWVLDARGRPTEHSEELLDRIKTIDPECRPLYAALIADVYADCLERGETPDVASWTQGNIVDDLLKREVSAWREREPRINEKHANLLMLATMVRGVHKGQAYLTDAELAGVIPQQGDSKQTQRDRLIAFAGRREDQRGGAFWMSPIEPDVFGEAFVLGRLAGERRFTIDYGESDDLRDAARRLVEQAWRHEGQMMGEFVLRCARDFPKHESLSVLLENPPGGESAPMPQGGLWRDSDGWEPIDAWAYTVASVMQLLITSALDDDGEAMTKTLLTLLRDAIQGRAESGTARPERLVQALAGALYNRGVRYGMLTSPQTQKAIADYTAVIKMEDAPADLKAEALFNRGVSYGMLTPPKMKKAITDYTAVIEMKDAPADLKAQAFLARGVRYGMLTPPQTQKAIADYTAVIEMKDAPAEQKALAHIGRGAAVAVGFDQCAPAAVDFAAALLIAYGADVAEETRQVVWEGTAAFCSDRTGTRDQAAALVEDVRRLDQEEASIKAWTLAVLGDACGRSERKESARVLLEAARDMFASLGDQENAEAAQRLLNDLDAD